MRHTGVIQIQIALPAELGRVDAFYRETSYSGGVSADDTILIAECAGELAGALRLCLEHGVIVLRGMRVRGEFQRQRIGTALLLAAKDLLGNRTCYCLPHRYLRGFYGQGGFVELPPTQAPQGLRDRLAENLACGLNVTIMRTEHSRFNGASVDL